MTFDMQHADEVTQVIKKSGLIESNLDLGNLDESLLLDFVESKSQRRIERRKHQRFKVNKFAFALIRSATTKPIKTHAIKPITKKT